MTVRTPEFIISYIDTAAGKNLSQHIYFCMEVLEHTDTFIMTHQEGKICHKSPKYIILKITEVFFIPAVRHHLADQQPASLQR